MITLDITATLAAAPFTWCGRESVRPRYSVIAATRRFRAVLQRPVALLFARMRAVILAATCTGLLVACSDSGPTPGAQGPAASRPSALPDLEHDFGIIPHGEKREHEFELDLRRLGEPIVPLRVHLDCSCGLADMRLRRRDGRERIVDGNPSADHAATADETLIVRVVINTNGKEAVDLPKTPSRGFIVLQPTCDLTGNLRVNWPIKLLFGIDAPVVLRPFAAFDFGKVPVSGTGELITELRGDAAHPGLKFGPVAISDPLDQGQKESGRLSVAIEPADDGVVLRARCEPGELGNHRAIVAIGTNLASGYRVHLLATWKTVPDLEATPLSKISFRTDLKRAQDEAEATGQFVLVTDHDRRRTPEFAVHQIVSADGRDLTKSFEVKLTPIQGQERQRRLLVRYLGGLTEAVRGAVVLTKDGAQGPFLSVDLVVFPRKS